MSWKKKKANSTCARTFLGARPPNSRRREVLNHLAFQIYLLHSWLQDPINWDCGGSIYSIYQYMRFYCWTGDIQQLATGSIPKYKVAVSNFVCERPRSTYMIIFRYQCHLCWNCAWVCLKWSTSKTPWFLIMFPIKNCPCTPFVNTSENKLLGYIIYILHVYPHNLPIVL